MIALPPDLPIPLRTDANGTIRIGDTRITLDSVVYAFQQDETPESIIDSFPTLKLPEVYSVIAYYLNHREEVDKYLYLQEAAADQLRQEMEANHPEMFTLQNRLKALKEAKG